MGTFVEFNIPVDDEDSVKMDKALKAAEERIAQIEGRLSIFNPSSEVFKINSDNEKKYLKPSYDIYFLVKKSKEYFLATNGTFDITVAPLTEVWGFGSKKASHPDPKDIIELLGHVGLDKIELDKNESALIFKAPDISLDFGGIAKGYAVDETVKILKKYGIDKGIVNIGGDLFCIGSNQVDEPWTVGIRDPGSKANTIASIKLEDMAVATSGG
ncbi:MAG: FAD:protein FMN transferase, partial [Candidatus Omnitrophica bacterium]|nr:FAD:protein FMN transferase [Candidatus Omnitrophota bacterium]